VTILEKALNVGSVIMKRIVSIGLWMVGGPLLLIALVSGGASLLSLLERVQHGPGSLFADGEFFGFIALIAMILGAAMLFIARKLSASEKQ
jgi:hypothetical protein